MSICSFSLLLLGFTACLTSGFNYPKFSIAGITSDRLGIKVSPNDMPYQKKGSIAIHAVPILNNTCMSPVRATTHDFPVTDLVLQVINLCPNTWYAVCSEFRAVISNQTAYVASGWCDARRTPDMDGEQDETVLMPLEFKTLAGNKVQVAFSAPSGLSITATAGFKGKSQQSFTVDPRDPKFKMTFSGITPVNKPFRDFCWTWDMQSTLDVLDYVDSSGFEVKKTLCATVGIEKYNSVSVVGASVILIAGLFFSINLF